MGNRWLILPKVPGLIEMMSVGFSHPNPSGLQATGESHHSNL
jgi:hypothetical protein